MTLRIVILLGGVLLTCAAITPDIIGDPWAPPTLASPLGTDEFGRNHLIVLLSATGRSLVLGLIIASALIIANLLISYFFVFSRQRALSELSAIGVQTAESVPAMIWTLVIVSAFGGANWIGLIVTLFFVLTPFAFRVISGELSRLKQEPYIESLQLLRLPASRVLLFHIVPNAKQVLSVLALQVTGICIGIQGAIGVFGFANRSEVELGTILLRGRENMIEHPVIFISAIVGFFAIYLLLYQVLKAISSSPSEHSPASVI